MWQFAGMTAAVGMGVVFAALLLLSIYMHYFKTLVARLDGKGGAAPAPGRGGPRAGGAGKRQGPESPAGDHQAGIGPVIAAIAAALTLRRKEDEAAATARPFPGWKMAGHWAAMEARVARQERPRAA